MKLSTYVSASNPSLRFNRESPDTWMHQSLNCTTPCLFSSPFLLEHTGFIDLYNKLIRILARNSLHHAHYTHSSSKNHDAPRSNDDTETPTEIPNNKDSKTMEQSSASPGNNISGNSLVLTSNAKTTIWLWLVNTK